MNKLEFLKNWPQAFCKRITFFQGFRVGPGHHWTHPWLRHWPVTNHNTKRLVILQAQS